MKTMTKKMGAIVLALAMCFSLCCTALAANSEDTDGSITIAGAVAGEEYTIYQMFDLTYTTDEEGFITSYSYLVYPDWINLLTSDEYKEYFTLTSVQGSTYIDPESKIFQEENDSTFMAAFAQAALTYAEENEIKSVATISFTAEYNAETGEITATPSENCTIVENSVARDEDTGVITAALKIVGLDLGYYLIGTSLGSLCMLDTTAPDAVINEKNDTPDVRKTVDLLPSEGMENHRTVEYELDIDHITGAINLVLHDNMQIDDPDHVTYDFDYDNMSVILYDYDEETEEYVVVKIMEKDVDYVLVTREEIIEEGDEGDDPCDFHVVFTVDGVNYDFSNCSDKAYIEVKVACELDALDDTYFQNDELDIPNLASVTYGNKGQSIWRRADVYEYGFHIYKFTEDEESEETPLAGAHFMLTNNNPGTEEEPNEDYGLTGYFSGSDGTYTLQGWGDIPEESGYTNELVSDSEGNISIEGLGAGSYIITETAAPDGYNMLDYTIEVTITADEEDPSYFTVAYQPSTSEESTTATDHTVPVENNAGAILPSTGGIGTTIFYIIGGVLVAGAVVVLITRRRMSHEA